MRFYQPKSLVELFNIYATLSPDNATFLAGGTDLMPRYERGQDMPDHLIDLKRISEMNQIVITADRVAIGALTSIQDIHDNDLLKTEFTALRMAAHDFAGAQIRHRGTIGGNICNASPAGDLLPALYAFGAILTIQTSGGTRELPINEFIIGPGRTTLQPGEILTTITLDRNKYDSNFQKVGLRQSMAISVVNVAFVYTPGFSRLKIAAGAVGPTVVTLDSFTTAFLKDSSNLAEIIHLIEADITPIDDIRATAKYRRQVLKNLIRNFLTS